MKSILYLIAFVAISQFAFAAKTFQLQSPSGSIELRVSLDKTVTYEVKFKGASLILPSTIALEVEQNAHTKDVYKLVSSKIVDVNQSLEAVVPCKSKHISDVYRTLQLRFKGNLGLEFRVYDDGVAYQWKTFHKDAITIISEDVNMLFANDYNVWFPEEKSMYSHQEREYLYTPLSKISADRFCSTGTLVDATNGLKVFISESDLENYPGLFLQGASSGLGFKGKFAAYPARTKQTSDRDVVVEAVEPYLAKTKGNRSFPWRVIGITADDKQLLESTLVWKLASANRLADVSWIKPGKVAWDWWNDWNIYGVDFKSGVNTQTYKYYIDFASDYKLEYIILDEGWYELSDVMKIKPEIDLKELIAYGKQKNVDVILWVTWKALDDKMEEAMKTYSAMGAKGLKVDFMQRDDQWMVDYYYRVAEMAGRYKLLIDFHGAYKPTGLHRTYPNVLSFEGVCGLEQNKWSNKAKPAHNLVLPFIRQVAGPMDYTPGAMINANESTYKPRWGQPMGLGTRCHELAKYVVFESPLQMLADNPSNYRKEADAMEFLSQVPSVWDTTLALDAKVGEYVVLARRSGKTWYLGVMTNDTKTDFMLDLSFLPKGDYKAVTWQDGINADKHPSDYKKQGIILDNTRKLHVKTEKGGGFVAILKP